MSGTRSWIKFPMSNSSKQAVIDLEDYDLVNDFGKWYVNDSGYGIKKTRIKGKNVSIRMHALINNTPKDMNTDHINGDKLDNRKINLRTATATLNAWNKTRPVSGRKYDLPPGITFDLQRNKYIARRVTFKRFDTKQEAIKYLEGERHEWK